jgi:dolichol-phosphate mannosyltransferase
MEKISFVVPAYNEQDNILALYEKISNLMTSLKEYDWELIFINDGSRDDTLLRIKEAAQKDKRVRYLNFSRNFGHQAALTAGLDHADGDAVVTLDCDLQDPPELIKEMIDKWKMNFNIVYARRKLSHEGLLKKYTSKYYYKVLRKVSNVRMPRNVGDFRLIDKKVLQQLTAMREKARYLRGMVAWTGFPYTYVDFERPLRASGATGYSWHKMLKLAMDGLINFSTVPLKIGFVMGVISIIIGTLMLTYMAGDILLHNIEYPLYKFLVVILVMFMGFQFILMWLLGEYIGRIYEESKDRPLYIVKEKGNFYKNQPDSIDTKQR